MKDVGFVRYVPTGTRPDRIDGLAESSRGAVWTRRHEVGRGSVPTQARLWICVHAQMNSSSASQYVVAGIQVKKSVEAG